MVRPETVFNDYWEAEPGLRDSMKRLMHAWTGWPTTPGTEAIWHTAAEETGVRSAPESDQPSSQPIFDRGTDPMEMRAIRDFRDFLRDYTRSQRGDTIEAYRYVNEEPDVARSFRVRTLESWTTDVTLPRRFAELVHLTFDGTVATYQIPADTLYLAHYALPSMEQSEIVPALPMGTTYADFDLTPAEEWEF